MGLKSRYRLWSRRRKWQKAARDSVDLLREFVYLDEVSVYSLIASKDGMIATEVTDAQASSLQTELSGSLGVSSGFVKGEFGSSLHSGETQSTQVLRKAIVQSTFKDLHARVNDRLAVRPAGEREVAPKIATLADLEALRPDSCWVIDPSTLNRGCLVEMSVTLEAEPIFQARTVMSGVLDIIQDDASFFGIEDLGPLAQGAVISRMLDKLLVGLVPLRGCAIDYVVIVDTSGRDLVVHRMVYEQIVDDLDSEPLFLVGVAEQALFWKDIRRVVFSESTYSVLARLGRSSLQSSWTPLKLVDALGRVLPGMDDALQKMNRSIISTLAQGSVGVASETGSGKQRSVLLSYAGLLADGAGVEVTEAELEEGGLFEGAAGLDANSSVAQWRAAFDPLTDFIQSRSSSAIDRELASHCRTVARLQGGLGQLVVGESTTDIGVPDSQQGAGERLLDTEIIAIYW